jgi:Na+-transporting methylmalonyl-CoA/oxaloacetate decarboxylase gamma subunit
MVMVMMIHVVVMQLMLKIIVIQIMMALVTKAVPVDVAPPALAPSARPRGGPTPPLSALITGA